MLSLSCRPAFLLASIFGASLSLAAPVRAETGIATNVLVAQAAPIKGADVMGDKNRSGPDGWVQAPVTRDTAPAATVKSAGEPDAPRAVAKPASAKTMSAGDDPGTPIANPPNGPGKQNAGPK